MANDILDLLLATQRTSDAVERFVEMTKKGNDQLAKDNIISPYDDDNKSKNTLSSSEQSRLRQAAAIFMPFLKEKEKPEPKPTTLIKKVSEPFKKPLESKPRGLMSSAPKIIFEKEQNKDDVFTSKTEIKYKKIADIFVNRFFEVQKKQIKDTAEKTQTSTKAQQSGGDLSKILSGFGRGSEQSKGGLFSSLMSLLLGKKLIDGFRSLVSAILPDSLKRFKTRMIRKLTPKPIRNLIAKTLKTKRAIKRLPKRAFQAIQKRLPQPRQILSKAKSGFGNMLSGGLSALKSSSIGKAIGGGVSNIIGGVKSGISSISTGAKGVVSKVGSIAVDKAKGIVTAGAKAVLPSSGIKSVLKSIMSSKALGPVVSGLLAAYDVKQIKDRYERKEISIDDMQQQVGGTLIKAITSALGATGGALAAGALGSVIPGAGTALGGFIGSVAGGFLGNFAGDIFSKYILPPKYTKTIGAFFTNTPYPKDEMQDFIIKDRRVYKFSNKDELMGMKKDGAIDRYFSHYKQENDVRYKATLSRIQGKPTTIVTKQYIPPVTMKQDNKLISNPNPNIVLRPNVMVTPKTVQPQKSQAVNDLIKVNNTANEYLRVIAQNTASMIRALGDKSADTKPVLINTPTSSNSEKIQLPDNRGGYSMSPYSL